MSELEVNHTATPATECNETCNARSARRERAIQLLVGGATADEVARELRVNRATVWRWSRDPTFAVRFHLASRERALNTAARLGRASAIAIELLEDIVSNPMRPALVRIRAAEAILRRAPPLEAPGPEEQTPELQRERARVLLSNPPPELAEVLDATGWRRHARDETADARDVVDEDDPIAKLR
jgi:hypothetical protein